MFCDDKHNVFTLCEQPHSGLTLSKWNLKLDQFYSICLKRIVKCIWCTEGLAQEQKYLVKFKNEAWEYVQINFENIHQYLCAIQEINATFNSKNYGLEHLIHSI